MSWYRTDEAAELRRELDDARVALGEEAERRMKAEAEAREARRARDAALQMAESAKANKRDRGWQALSDTLRGAGFLMAVCGAVAVAGFAVRDCVSAAPPLAGGVITDRYHDPAYTTPAYTTQICTGRPMHCTPVYHPPVHHPERWAIRIAHDGRERFVELPEASWTRTAVGGSWCEAADVVCDFGAVERAR